MFRKKRIGVDFGQAQKRQPRQQALEVVTDGGEDGVYGVAGGVSKVVSSHAVRRAGPALQQRGGDSGSIAYDARMRAIGLVQNSTNAA